MKTPEEIGFKLTKLELEALLSAAGNGYCEGEYFCDAGGKDSGYGGMKYDAAYHRAVSKIRAGLNKIDPTEELQRISKENDDLRKQLHDHNGMCQKKLGGQAESFLSDVKRLSKEKEELRDNINFQSHILSGVIIQLNKLSSTLRSGLSDRVKVEALSIELPFKIENLTEILQALNTKE